MLSDVGWPRAQPEYRLLEKSFDGWIIASAIIVSFLGTFTATQLMIQARTSSNDSHKLLWILAVSLVFGFCSLWSLHFVGMLACTMDVAIGLNLTVTIFTGVLAVTFTFVVLAGKILFVQLSKWHSSRSAGGVVYQKVHGDDDSCSVRTASLQDIDLENGNEHGAEPVQVEHHDGRGNTTSSPSLVVNGTPLLALAALDPPTMGFDRDAIETGVAPGIDTDWSLNDARLNDVMAMARQTRDNDRKRNVFTATFYDLVAGFCLEAMLMGLLWSLSLTVMHYGGLWAMQIPNGFMVLSPIPVLISAIISWAVCIAVYEYMTSIEPYLAQQMLFSVVAAVGFLIMHSTGLYAASFYTMEAPSTGDTWPSRLPIAIESIALLTCLVTNAMLAQTAILSRNRLAEIVWTRKTLWRAIAAKEHAVASANARSVFIAAASHEIRTPLHHIQGFTDLMAKSTLAESDRELLDAIRSATRTLSLVTNNVLDWSKLESNIDADCRPTPTDIRATIEAILPMHSQIEGKMVCFMAVVHPDVPKSVMLDETYLQRILMNLLSNATKFIDSGYIQVCVETTTRHLIVRVEDTGMGIPKDFVGHLFQPYSQSTNKGSQRGTGLGLSIVKQLTTKMGGVVTVESVCTADVSPGESTGTTFTVTLPLVLPTTDQNLPSLNFSSVSKIAIFPDQTPFRQQGHIRAWERFGVEVVKVSSVEELKADEAIRHVWATAVFLLDHPIVLNELIADKSLTIYAPYNKPEHVRRLSAATLRQRVVPVPSPHIWHTLEARTAVALTSSTKGPRRGPRLVKATPAQDLKVRKVNTKPDGLKDLAQVMLVEDNELNQKLGKKMLNTLGCTVIVANDGVHAIELLREHDTTISLILMDQQMPRKDGIEATKDIRQLEAQGVLTRKHLIIACTAVVNSQSRTSFTAAGADDFLSKPLTLAQLEHTLTTLLRPEY